MISSQNYTKGKWGKGFELTIKTICKLMFPKPKKDILSLNKM